MWSQGHPHVGINLKPIEIMEEPIDAIGFRKTILSPKHELGQGHLHITT